MQQFEEQEALQEQFDILDAETRNALKCIEREISKVAEDVEAYLQSVVGSCDPEQEGYRDHLTPKLTKIEPKQ